MRSLVGVWAVVLASCGTGEVETPPELDVYSWAKGCFTVESDEGFVVSSASGVRIDGSAADATPFFFQPSDLGTYLLYDPDGGYLMGDGAQLTRETQLESDVTLVDDTYISGAEWEFETAWSDWERYQFRNRASRQLLGEDGMTREQDDGLPLRFVPAEGCATFPELGLDAEGAPARTTFEDGTLYGIVDAHSHVFSNFGFGGGLFHGSAYHRLGVEHALGDCEVHHGPNGRRDFFGFAYDAGNDGGNLGALIPDLAAGELSEDNHVTDGYPDFTEWPNARKRSTHQTQYYRWIERAYLSGLRLMVQHATSNEIICEISVGAGYSPSRYDCDDMTAVDRVIAETYLMERYIDAQHGGPGEGWFRVVKSPAEAREVIEAGKLAVVLGIETSDLFGCEITPKEGDPVCDEAHIDRQLDWYHKRGVRVMFPVHKYDNAFTPGDGSGDFIEVGNFLNSGHWTNMTEDCPADVGTLDGGAITFGGLLQPRDEYLSPAPVDFSGLEADPLPTILPYAGYLLDGPLEGEWCQNATITPMGEYLLAGMMRRGMVVELDHFPKWSYKRAYEMLQENDYPAVGTHGNDYGGRIYDIGGLGFDGFDRCQDPNTPGASLRRYQDKLDQMEAAGLYRARGFAFDLNGFAGARGPRFGEEGCGEDQPNRLTYPFESFDGGVTFTQATVGNRVIDFNTEGMVHLGLMPELIQDLRADAVSDEDLEPLFRSAEGYIRMWEKAEARGAALRGE